jgi:hypothetical protein
MVIGLTLLILVWLACPEVGALLTVLAVVGCVAIA